MADPVVVNPSLSPTYARHRHIEGAAGLDVLPVLTRASGINMEGFKNANVQVITDGASAPQIRIMFWSANTATPAFIDDEVILLPPAKAAGVDWEITVPCGGREMLVAVTGGCAGVQEAWIYVAGVPN